MRNLLLSLVPLALLCGIAPAQAMPVPVEPTVNVTEPLDFYRVTDYMQTFGVPAPAPVVVAPISVAKAEKPTVAKAAAKVKKKKVVQQSFFYGKEMGVYKGPAEMAWTGYEKGKKSNKKYLKILADQPKVQWVGAWQKDHEIYRKTKIYIENAQAGDPNKVVSFASFRLQPWYTGARTGKPTSKQRASYKKWVREHARAIGNTPAIVILQPDMPFLMTAKHRKNYTSLLKYAAKQYSKNKNTRLYFEAGAADWPAKGQGGAKAAVKFLEPIGIKYADGIALNSTHYSDPKKEVLRAKEIIDLLRKKGYKHDLKAVINTATSGNPWVFGHWRGKGVADEVPACTKKSQFGKPVCVSLGIPPTFDVSNPKWGLSAKTNKRAAKYVDAYLWHGRPWLNMQASPFMEKKAVRLVKYSPYRKFYS